MLTRAPAERWNEIGQLVERLTRLICTAKTLDRRTYSRESIALGRTIHLLSRDVAREEDHMSVERIRQWLRRAEERTRSRAS